MLDLQQKLDEQVARHKQELSDLSHMFSGMKVDVNQMEWTGGQVQKELAASQIQKPIKPEEDERDIVTLLNTTNECSKIVIDER